MEAGRSAAFPARQGGRPGLSSPAVLPHKGQLGNEPPLRVSRRGEMQALSPHQAQAQFLGGEELGSGQRILRTQLKEIGRAATARRNSNQFHAATPGLREEPGLPAGMEEGAG